MKAGFVRRPLWSPVIFATLALAFVGHVAVEASAPLRERLEMRHWQPVQAYPMYVGHGTGRFRYPAAGRWYLGERLAPEGTPEPVLQSLSRRLGRAMREGRKLTVHVDPGDPRRAVLEPRPDVPEPGLLRELLPCLAFALPLLALLGHGLRGEVRPVGPPDPSAPWRMRPAWDGAPIRPDAHGTSALALAATITFSLAVMHLGWPAPEPERPPLAIGTLLGLVSLVLWGLAARGLKIARSAREPRAVLAPFPGRVGGVVAGEIRAVPTLPVGSRASCTLRAIDVGAPGGKTRRVRELWSECVTARPVDRGEGTATIPFRFEVPSDLPSSHASTPGAGWQWWLELRCDAAWLRRRFELPVYPLSGSEPVTAERERYSPFAEALAVIRSADDRTPLEEPDDGDHDVPGPLPRTTVHRRLRPAQLLVGLGVTLFATLGAALLAGKGESAFAAFFGMSGVLGAIVTLRTLTCLSFVCERGRLHRSSTLFGLRFGTRTFELERVERVEVRPTAGTSHHRLPADDAWFDVVAVGPDGRERVLADKVIGRHEAWRLTRLFRVAAEPADTRETARAA